MAFNINLIINNYIICGIISTSVYCAILLYTFWKGRPGQSKSSLDEAVIVLLIEMLLKYLIFFVNWVYTSLSYLWKWMVKYFFELI